LAVPSSFFKANYAIKIYKHELKKCRKGLQCFMAKPKIITAREAAYMVNDGDNIAVATFGCSGTPEEILMEVEKRFLETGHPKNIGYTHAAGGGGFGATKENGFCRCEDHLAHTGLMTRWVCSHAACSDFTTQQLMDNKIAGWNLPLGTLLQVYKDQARGMKGTLSRVGLGTFVDPRIDGGCVNQLAKDSEEQFVEYIPDFRGEEMLFFKGMDLNIAWMRGTKADKNGNISTDREPYNRREWLAILTTDLALDNVEIVRVYGMRWSIETFFKMAKSHLKLGTEFQGRSFDMMISHTTIVFSRYLVLEWERRENNDDRSLGGLFYLLADEVMDLDLKTALRQLMAFVLNLLPDRRENYESLCQLYKWISELPSYIKALFAQSGCES
jgi:acyl CoA:acetate/3-ketoacid CoA transferase alpha subunit